MAFNILIYTTLGYNIKWFDIILVLIDSLIKYSSPINFDFLIICDDNMNQYINDYLNKDNIKNKYSNLNINTHNIGFNSSKPDRASMNKLHIFDYKYIDNYDKILFIDADIIATLNINNILNLDLDDDILYVYKESSDINHHNNICWGLQNYSNNDIKIFKKNGIYPFNCGLFYFNNTIGMKNDFSNILDMISSYRGNFFYEQSFMNVYFNKKGNICYNIFTDDNYKMFPDLNIKYTDKIIHFCCAVACADHKLKTMNDYINQHL